MVDDVFAANIKDTLDHPESVQQHKDYPHMCTGYWKRGGGDEGDKLKDAGKREGKVTDDGAGTTGCG